MSVLSHLQGIANGAIISDQEKLSIQTSIAAIRSRLTSQFGSDIYELMLFGSYTRNTILPRRFDEQSDIDYMVVFRDSDAQPQTYLDRLRRFVERYYSTSQIQQSHPTIQLELNHIRFELVPACYGWLTGYRIPAKASSFTRWQSTDPRGFNEQLTSENQSKSQLIKPLIRVMKYWNVQRSRPFESYELEQAIVNYAGGIFAFYGANNLRDYLYAFVKGYEPSFGAQWRRDEWRRLQEIVRNAQNYEDHGYVFQAETEIKKAIPFVYVGGR